MDEKHFLGMLNATAQNDCPKLDQLLNNVNLSDGQEKLRGIIQIAAEKGNLNVIRYLGEREPSIIRKKSTNGDTVAHIAARIGAVDIIDYVAQKYPTIINERNNDGETIIDIAARFGHPEVIDPYIKKIKPSFDVMAKNKKNETILEVAARYGHVNILRHMKRKGYIQIQDPWKCDNNTVSMLRVAAQSGQLDVIKEVPLFRYEYKSLAQIAAENGQLEIFFYIVDNVDSDPLWYEKYLPHILSKNITDRRMMESLLGILSELEQNGFDFMMTDFLIEKPNLNINLIRYIAEKNPEFFVKYRRHRDFFLIEAFKHDALDLSILKLLCERGISLNVTSNYGFRPDANSILHIAAEKGKLDIIQFVGEAKPHMLEMRNSAGETVSHIAAMKGHLNIIYYVSKVNPAVLNIQDHYGQTTLHIAITHDIIDLKTLKFLVEEKRVSLKKINWVFRETLAHVAGRQRRFDLLNYIVSNEPFTLDKRDRRGDTVLHLMANVENCTYMDTFKWLVEEKGLLLNATNEDGKTVTHLAIANNNADIVRYIIEEKPLALDNSDLDDNSDLNDNSDLDLAVQKNFVDLQTLKRLIQKGVSIGWKVASIVARKGNLDFVRYLVEELPSPFADEHILLDMAESAAVRQHLNIVLYLLNRDPGIFVRRLDILFKLGYTTDIYGAIECLAKSGIQKIRAWSSNGFESEVTHEIVRRGHIKLLKYFVEKKKWNVDILHRGEPPVFTAVRSGHLEILKYLAGERGANLTILNKVNENIMFVAAEMNDISAMKYVLDEEKAPINLEWQNNANMTLLHIAFEKALTSNNFFILDYLIGKDVCIDARMPNGSTPLHVATCSSNYHMCDYLLKHGANPKLKDETGCNFWQYLRFKDKIRKRRTVDISHLTPDFDTPSAHYFTRERNPSVVSTDLTVRTGNVDTGEPTLQVGFQNYLMMAIWSFRNSRSNLKEPIMHFSPLAALRNKMDPNAITAVYTYQ